MIRALRFLVGGSPRPQPRKEIASSLRRRDDIRDSARLHRLGCDTQWDAMGELAKRWPNRPTLNDFPALADMVAPPPAPAAHALEPALQPAAKLLHLPTSTLEAPAERAAA